MATGGTALDWASGMGRLRAESRRRLLHVFGEREVLGDRYVLGPGGRVDADAQAERLAAERLQAGAQHLAALAERGGGDALQPLHQGVGRPIGARREADDGRVD